MEISGNLTLLETCAEGQATGDERQKSHSEQEAVRELLYAFQGICGNILGRNEQVKDHLRFKMSTEHGGQTLQQQVLHMAVLGTLYQKVNSFVELHSLHGESLFFSALASALRQQLTSFLGLLAHLECLLASQKITLLQLRVKTLGAKNHLSWLVTITEACKFQLGCNVMSTLHNLMLTFSGNPNALRSASPIFLRVSEVFYRLLKEWLLCARPTDPFDEFFIAISDTQPETMILKPDFYQLRTLMCPNNLSKAQINRIMKAGQNYALLKKILEEKQPLEELHLKLDKIIEKVITDADHGVNAWETDGAMHTFLIEMERRVSQKLADALLRHGKLYVHLDILTGFFLLRQSGFAAQLIMKTFDMLSAAAPLVSEYTLREKLRLAINDSTSPEQEDVYLEKRFKIHLNPQPEHNLGWDSFSITYELEEANPVALVVTNEVLEKYYFCFREILQLRRMEWMLCDILKSIKTTYRKLHQLTGSATEKI
ncbi:gamma-tubulin complex component 3-like [Cloeon dipterum]|uniref:gamma-tubulin complex component 3-like n=1 Tax=Cloeon dipterum TaxID=197152 RepID=UPI00322093D5